MSKKYIDLGDFEVEPGKNKHDLTYVPKEKRTAKFLNKIVINEEEMMILFNAHNRSRIPAFFCDISGWKIIHGGIERREIIKFITEVWAVVLGDGVCVHGIRKKSENGYWEIEYST